MTEVENVLVGNEDLVMQAIWICIHLHGASSGANSVVGNTAAMTIRQVVSLAFGKVHKSPEAKHVGVLVFQELSFMSREENGAWLKRTAVSPLSAALGVELLETILGSNAQLFREDEEFKAVLKQHICSLIQCTLEMGCLDKAGSSSSGSSSALSLNSNSGSGSSGAGPFFPLLVRVMRLASTVLCNFGDCMEDECIVIINSLIEIVATGAYYQPGSAKSPNAKLAAHEGRNFLAHANSSSNTLNSGSGAVNVNFVTWPVLLSLEVLNRLCVEGSVITAMTTYTQPVLVSISKTVSSVITTSPPMDFKPQGNESLLVPRSGLELVNEQDSPALQQFYNAIRVAATCQSNLISSIFELSRITEDASQCSLLAEYCISDMAPFVIHALNSTVRHCREVDLITMSLKSYHVLATIASRLRANVQISEDTSMHRIVKPMDEIVIACLRALCAFSFPLPESIRGVGKTANGSTGGSAEDDAAEEAETYVALITWREVHAMKALFGAAHIMDEELSEVEWCVLLEGFEIVVGLTDPKLKHGQHKLPSKAYRISAFRAEDEDVEQQLVMLGNSIVEFFRDALKLSSGALRKLLSAVRKVCWDQVGLPIPSSKRPTFESEALAAAIVHPSTTRRSTLHPQSSLSAADSGSGQHDLSSLSSNHQMKIYQNYLGVGLTGAGTFMPCFALRMLTQLAASSKRCFEQVMKELLLMSTFVPQPPLAGSHFPQLSQFQVFTTDSILQLMQSALMSSVNSLSPTTKLPNQATLDDIEAFTREHAVVPHVFDQQELFLPISKLIQSDVKDRTLYGLLDLLNSCGHLVNTGWPILYSSIQEAGERGDSKTQVMAFKCLRLIVDDLLVNIPKLYLPNCVTCIGKFALCAKDVNISLTAVNELWSVADLLGKLKANSQEQSRSNGAQWGVVFNELQHVALDERTEVRNCAINTLFGSAVTYGAHFILKEWQLFVDDTVLPLAFKLVEEQRKHLSANGTKAELNSKATPNGGYVMHHSRDSAEKQWNESRVLLLTGISRVFQTNWHYLLLHKSWFSMIWRHLLRLMSLNAERGMSKEVVLAAVQTLQTLLQVSSSGDFDQIAQSQPVRAGAGMRVVGGALVALSPPNSNSAPASSGVSAISASSKRSGVSGVTYDPVLWEEAFALLLRICTDRWPKESPSDPPSSLVWIEADEQEIASSVVAVLVTLYLQAKEHEFRQEANVARVLDLFEVLIVRHVLSVHPESTKPVSNLTTNSLPSRVLNAFEECDSFSQHPALHTKMLDQMVLYVSKSASMDLVFFTRHALTSLAKLYVSTTAEARGARFVEVLLCVHPFLKSDPERNPAENESQVTEESPKKPHTVAQQAASQLWKNALRVLSVLISHGLAAVRLEDRCWRPLLETITLVLQPSQGIMPSFVQGEEDEELVLSILECLVDSLLAVLAVSNSSQDVGPQYTEFCDELMKLLASGVHAKRYHKRLTKCCVRQLATLSIQAHDPTLATLTQTTLVDCCTTELHNFAALEDRNTGRSSRQSSIDSSNAAAALAAATSASLQLASTPEYIAARERVVILLSNACEVGMRPQRILELFPALCCCITSSDLEVRQLIQRVLVNARITEYCLEIMAGKS